MPIEGCLAATLARHGSQRPIWEGAKCSRPAFPREGKRRRERGRVRRGSAGSSSSRDFGPVVLTVPGRDVAGAGRPGTPKKALR